MQIKKRKRENVRAIAKRHAKAPKIGKSLQARSRSRTSTAVGFATIHRGDTSDDAL